MRVIRARLVGWIRRHAILTICGLLVVAALICWGGYRWTRYRDAQADYRNAQQAVDRQEWKSARASLKEAMRKWPDSPDMYLLAARVERRLESLDEAAKLLDTCQRLQGNETQAIKVERALLQLHAGKLAEVEGFLRECIQRDDPDTVEILDILAGALEISYRDAAAQRCLDELLKRQPQNFDALVRRGRTARNMGWHEDAIQYYEKALLIRPDVENVRLALAETQVGYGQFDRAREHLEWLRERQPQNPGVLFGLARCTAASGANDRAMELLNQILTANPNNWMALNERGKLAVQCDRPEDALSDLRKADALAPPDVAPTHLVSCLLLLGKREEALIYQEKAARILTDRKRSAELGDLIREKAPDDPELRYELGCVLLRLGKQRDAVHWFRTALEKNPRHRKTHEALVQFFLSVRAFDQAEHHQRILQQL